MKFGDIDELTAKAKDIVAKDSKYVNHVYGEEEAGGTCWIYISDTPFEKLGFRDVPKKSLPEVTAPFMHASPILGGIWFVVLAGLYFFTKRRDKIQTEKKDESKTV